MQIVRDPTTYHSHEPLHMAIGMFDGVHLGHRAVIESAINAASSHRGKSVVMTFTPHPSQILRPQNPTLLIQSEKQKEERLAAVGVDILVWQSFSKELAAVPADQYLMRLKMRFPTLASVHVGENFRFGHGRTGNISTLLATSAEQGVHVLSIERVRFDGEPISSTRIRDLLLNGSIDEANDLLGYNYFCEGKVVGGNKLGRTIGFPTLNIPWQPQCQPRHGVYAVRIRRVDEPTSAALPGVANYGLRPTIDENTKLPILETHILAPCPFTEGDELYVEWLHFIRPERKFEGMEMLKAQISEDRDTAKQFLGL